eukprot:scaffold254308_cov18-Prasinocladus_malaysianus.AAC.1
MALRLEPIKQAPGLVTGGHAAAPFRSTANLARTRKICYRRASQVCSSPSAASVKCTSEPHNDVSILA